jgi:signal transduction histidine kinase
MQAIEIGILIINLISLSICGGLVFSLLTSANRDQSSNLFAIVCGGFALWASMSLIRQLSFDIGISDLNFVQLNLNILMSAMLVSSALYFVFMARYTDLQGTLIDILNIAVSLVALVGFILIWTNNLVIVQRQALWLYSVTDIGFVIIGFTLGYLLVSVWLMLNATTERSAMLFRPTILLFFAYVVASFDIWTVNLSLDVLLLSVVTSWIGFKILRRQVVNPQEALNHDLKLTNHELQRTINDLAQEKSKTETLNVELLQANRYKDQFLATMSHELRTPLNSIVGYSELLMTNMYGSLEQKQLDRLERIHRNGRHLTHIINAILDLNKIDSGRIQLDVEEFSLVDAIRAIEEEFKPRAEEALVEFIITIPDDVPVYRGDRKRIAQVMQTILDNAFKFTSTGNIKITLNYTIVEQGKSDSFSLPTIGWLKDGHWAVIEISDTGTGIEPEDQARIFDRFSQADSSRTREYEGIGLGLTIARKLVELHDGLIWVKSYVGQGSTFYIALPFQSIVIR